MTVDRDIPQSTWNNYLKKYTKEYRIKRDACGVWQILTKHGTIQTYSIVNKKLCAVQEFNTSRQLSGFLSKIRGLAYTISQIGYSDVVVVFNEKDLALFVKPCFIRKRRKIVVSEARRQQLIAQLQRNRSKKARLRR